jgi:DNA invertase Pin-like site-specific DNA recombinase
MSVCHKCDNPACVNVEHLFLGTHSDNMGDAAAKGRMRRGSDHPRSRLTKEAVIAIRRRNAAGEPKKALAREFGVTGASVWQVISRKTWKHISASEAA